jgi:hypothetical protein
MFAVAAGLGLRAQRPYVPPVETLPGPPVEQPIAYSHALHVGTLGLKCADCHKADKDGFRMNYPAEEKCMACHSAIAVESPHIQKLAEFASKAESVPWVPIYRVPAFVWFAHDSQTEAGVACEVCHGPVAEREVLFKEKPTNMTSCMQCHAEHSAPNDCDFCHDPG